MENHETTRRQKIISHNKVAILLNLLLSLFKIVIGVSVRSRAIILDAVDGLTEMMASVISIISVSAASKKADKGHPLGYGRIEYVSSLFITILIIYLGIQAIISSVGEMMHSEGAPSYDSSAIAIMLVSFLVKAYHGVEARHEGKKLDSEAMIITGTDSLGGAAVSLLLLLSIFVNRVYDINLEPIISIIISVMICTAGIKMARNCTNKLIGQRPDPEFKKKIMQTLVSEDGVLHVCNLVIHTYGEGAHVGSVDIEVSEDMTAAEATKLSRRLIRKAKEHGLTLTSVGITGSNISDPRAAEIIDTVIDRARKYKDIIRTQLFTVDFEEKVISFYVVLDYSSKDRENSLEQLKSELEEIFPDMTIDIATAIDI